MLSEKQLVIRVRKGQLPVLALDPSDLCIPMQISNVGPGERMRGEGGGGGGGCLDGVQASKHVIMFLISTTHNWSQDFDHLFLALTFDPCL